jgi:hypothetical protein
MHTRAPPSVASGLAASGLFVVDPPHAMLSATVATVANATPVLLSRPTVPKLIRRIAMVKCHTVDCEAVEGRRSPARECWKRGTRTLERIDE